MSVSTSLLRPAIPVSACALRRLPSNSKGTGHHTDRERTDRLGDACDHGSTTGSGSATLARGHENHVGTREGLFDLFRVVLGGATADLGVRSGAQSTGDFATDIELDVGVTHEQCLRIGVDGDEFDASEAKFDHPVDSVDAATADADHLDDR